MIENEKISFEKDDNFNREPIAEKMITLLLSDADVSPMLIDGKWGTGKTTFCKKSIDLIEKKIQDKREHGKPIKCTYIDAFTADHANEPLITIIAAISKLVDKEPLKSNFIEKAKGIARFSLKTTLKAGTAWILKANYEYLGQELSDTLKNSSEEGINYTIDRLIKEHEEVENNISTLKEALTEITKTQELIIFIDELDRCRPDFAVAVVECIKHIFETPGIQFVLLANLEQIEAAIKHCYGVDVDAKKYLNKFLKFSFTLPHEVTNKNNLLATIEHAKNLIQDSKILNNSRLVEQQCISFFNELISQNSLSLREVETFIRYLEIHYTLSNRRALDGANIFALLYILAVFVFVVKPNIRDKIESHHDVSPSELSSLMGIKSYQSNLNKEYPASSQVVAALIHIAFHPENETIEQAELIFWKQHFNTFFQDETKARTDLYSFFIDEFRKLRLQF